MADLNAFFTLSCSEDVLQRHASCQGSAERTSSELNGIRRISDCIVSLKADLTYVFKEHTLMFGYV